MHWRLSRACGWRFSKRRAPAKMLQRALRRLGATVEEAFKNVDSDLNRLLRQELHRRLELFRVNIAAQEQLDDWVKNLALELVEQRHDMIGQIWSAAA